MNICISVNQFSTNILWLVEYFECLSVKWLVKNITYFQLSAAGKFEWSKMSYLFNMLTKKSGDSSINRFVISKFLIFSRPIHDRTCTFKTAVGKTDYWFENRSTVAIFRAGFSVESKKRMHIFNDQYRNHINSHEICSFPSVGKTDLVYCDSHWLSQPFQSTAKSKFYLLSVTN